MSADGQHGLAQVTKKKLFSRCARSAGHLALIRLKRPAALAASLKYISFTRKMCLMPGSFDVAASCQPKFQNGS